LLDLLHQKERQWVTLVQLFLALQELRKESKMHLRQQE
jgi:hypothetical protein